MLIKTIIVLKEITKVEPKTKLEVELSIGVRVGLALELNPKDKVGKAVANNKEVDKLYAEINEVA